MSTEADSLNPLVEGRRTVLPARVAGTDYGRLHRVLVSKARWLGSRHPEDAAQEALKRSLENPKSQAAVEYYFSDEEPCSSSSSDWSLDQLVAWLHGVLHYVVREEYSRASTRREFSSSGIGSEDPDADTHLNPRDPAPSQLDDLIRRELQSILVDCFPKLEKEHRTVLEMRADGLTYNDIANQLGVNENTVATWISRGMRALAQRVRNRTKRGIPDV